ncbi:MAG: bifunctional folylpolyglutamate synthase/dihydrofolate synthase, partial [Caulobacteraceae bacterium]|nr:bifunctional folylpolyglutamate synthase/dihydrofolate synthase [Caulobacter sp.]
MADLLTPHDGAELREALARLQARHPLKVDLGLDRIDAVCAALGRPELRLPPVIHVAGTNGKGSTTAFVRAMAEAAGLAAHVLTSPHLVRFVERLRLGGTLVEEAAVVDALARVEAAAGEAPLSFFEAVTAAQFLLMAEAPADLAVVEVGLGGRFDATNLVRPAVSVIAPVDMDHREFLGDTLRAIAGEKAGIAKPGAPLVVARQKPEAMEVIAAEASRVGARLLARGDAWDSAPT